MTRELRVVLILFVIVAGAPLLVPQERQHPAPRGGHPPGPTAAEESGGAEPDAIQAWPTRPLLHRQVAPPPRPVTRHRPPRDSLPTQSSAAQGSGIAIPQPPPVQARDDSARSPAGPRRTRDPGAGTEPGLTDEHHEGDEPGDKASSPQAGSVAREPMITPPVLLTPVAGYPAEGYRIAVDRGTLAPRLRIEAAQGRVVLRMLVQADGSVAQVDIVESSGVPVLDAAALRTAATWRFAPATRDGAPIDAWAIIPVRFVVP